MLRTLLVLGLIGVGGFYALRGPYYALLFYIGYAYFRPEAWVWVDFIGSLRLSLLSGLLVVLGGLYSKQQFVWNGRIALLWIFLLHTFLSAVFGESWDAWGSWFNFFKSIVISYFMVVLITNFDRLRLMFMVMALALGLEQAKQGWFYIVSRPAWHNENDVPFLGDNNGVAIGMLMLVPIIGALMQTSRRRWAKGGYLFLLIGCLNRSLSTHSRGGFLAAMAMAAFWWLRTKHKIAGAIVGIAVAAVVVTALPNTFWTRMDTIETFEEDRSAAGRLHFWQVALEMANAHPLFGIGFDGFRTSYNNYDFTGGRFGIFRAVHSTHFGVVADLGYLGAALFAALIFNAFRSCAKVRKLSYREPAMSDFEKCAVALQSSLIVFITGGTFISFQYNEMFWNIIGLTIVLERLARQRRAELSAGLDALKSSVDPVPAKVSSAA
jgi:putative inorganic carbon (hco3(-)) transporter